MDERAKKESIEPAEIYDFWLSAGPDKWFKKDPGFDREIKDRFGAIHEAAARGERDHWQEDAMGAMALVILLDQFPRNMFRDTPRAFATDAKALAVADQAVARGFDKALELPQRRFLYMPFMHAEDSAMQQRCIALCEASDDKEGLKYARIHAEIIERFGRFPHRNRVLGRETTPEEQRFLDEGGFAG
ncbi:MAG TPA: DUF924 family protein [Hyphomicrobiales bacterium]|nr:DUF924 family protein [Hyphomicrobiales bacterium]